MFGHERLIVQACRHADGGLGQFTDEDGETGPCGTRRCRADTGFVARAIEDGIGEGLGLIGGEARVVAQHRRDFHIGI